MGPPRRLLRHTEGSFSPSTKIGACFTFSPLPCCFSIQTAVVVGLSMGFHFEFGARREPMMLLAPGRSSATVSSVGGTGKNSLFCRRESGRRCSVILTLLLSLLSIDSLLDPRKPSLILIPALVFFLWVVCLVVFLLLNSVSTLVVFHPLAGILDHLLADVHQSEELLRPEKASFVG